jgi:hypothetical protein
MEVVDLGACSDADLVGPLPETGAAALSGEARPENLDVLGRELDKLKPAQQARLALQDNDIAERCQNLPPETFQRYLRRETNRIRRDYPDNDNGDEPSEAGKQKAASRFDMGRRTNGRWWLKGDLDNERHAGARHGLVAEIEHGHNTSTRSSSSRSSPSSTAQWSPPRTGRGCTLSCVGVPGGLPAPVF